MGARLPTQATRESKNQAVTRIQLDNRKGVIASARRGTTKGQPEHLFFFFFPAHVRPALLTWPGVIFSHRSI